MRGFLSFIIKYHFAIIFIVLQLISFVLIVSFNHTQRTIFINSSNTFTGNLNESVSSVTSYFALQEENIKLRKENNLLKNKLLSNYKLQKVSPKEVVDSLYVQRFSYISSQIIQSSVHKSRNFMTLDAGRKQNVEVGDGVISNQGIVGIVKNVSDHFSVVLPLINEDFKVSCRINRSQYFGSLIWNGLSYKTAKLNDIPFHVNVAVGDTLFTTGFSSIFPTNELVGVIKEVNRNSGDNFYDIDVNLMVDFNKIQSVYIVKQLLKQELDSLKVYMHD